MSTSIPEQRLMPNMYSANNPPPHHHSYSRKINQVLPYLNMVIDLMRRTYNRLFQGINLMGFSFGRLSRIIPIGGLMLNLTNLLLRGVLLQNKTENQPLKQIYRGLLFLLALASSVVVFNTGVMSIVWLSIFSSFVRVSLDVLDLSIILPKLQHAKMDLSFDELLRPYRDRLKSDANQHYNEALLLLALILKLNQHKAISQRLQPHLIQLALDNIRSYEARLETLQRPHQTHETLSRQLDSTSVRFLSNLSVALLTTFILTAAITNPPLAFSLLLCIECIEAIVIIYLALQFAHQFKTPPSPEEKAQALLEHHEVKTSFNRILNQLEETPKALREDSPPPLAVSFFKLFNTTAKETEEAAPSQQPTLTPN